MVRFSIREKFWKAHGLLYLFVVFPVIFPSFSHRFPGGKRHRHFPIAQISLKSHVITLY